MIEVVKSWDAVADGRGRIDPPAFPASPGDKYRVLTVVDNGDTLAQIVTNATRGGDWVGDVVKAYADAEGGGK